MSAGVGTKNFFFSQGLRRVQERACMGFRVIQGQVLNQFCNLSSYIISLRHKLGIIPSSHPILKYLEGSIL